MLTHFPIDDIGLSSKSSKLLFRKLIKAANEKISEKEMATIIANHKPVSKNSVFDIARLLKMLRMKMNDTLLLVKSYAYESESINNVGVVLSEHLKTALNGKDKMDDGDIVISWKTEKKLIVSDKKKSNKRGKK